MVVVVGLEIVTDRRTGQFIDWMMVEKVAPPMQQWMARVTMLQIGEVGGGSRRRRRRVKLNSTSSRRMSCAVRGTKRHTQPSREGRTGSDRV